MHGVVTTVTITDPESSESELRERVVPGVKQLPGFVTGYWLRKGNDGMSFVIFDSEDAANQAAERIPSVVPESVELQGVEVREVVANA